jgi:glutamyl-tRNA synthetase
MTDVRVRFAPSPTGELHIGGARTALFNWLFARHRRGTFLLRIEDTDAERSERRFTDHIFESLKWLGLDWDAEAIHQSQRRKLYEASASKLLHEGSAYRCFCSKARLDELREKAKAAGEPFVYDGACTRLSSDEVEAQMRRGEPYAVRFRVPDEGVTALHDIVYGDVEFENRLIGDFIIVRSDGTPTYNFTAVVDDVDLKISHVIRGDDHLSNTPKQILIYQALGAGVPQFAHLPLILGPDKSRLSKRHGATSVLELREQGFLPEAVFNCLALLGWSYDGVQEIFSREELVEKFSLERVSKAAAIFDTAKLEWMNGYYIRSLPRERIEQEAMVCLRRSGYDVDTRDAQWLSGIIGLELERAKTLREFAQHLDYFFSDTVSYDQKGAEQFFHQEGTEALLEAVSRRVGEMRTFEKEPLERELRALADELGVKFATIVHPTRLALTGRTASPGLFDVVVYLGKERVLARLEQAIRACREFASQKGREL